MYTYIHIYIYLFDDFVYCRVEGRRCAAGFARLSRRNVRLAKRPAGDRAERVACLEGTSAVGTGKALRMKLLPLQTTGEDDEPTC